MVRIGMCPISIHYMFICSYITVPTLLRRWTALEDGLELSVETFQALCDHFQPRIQKWLQEERAAQQRQHEDVTVMDIYDTTVAKGMRSSTSYASFGNKYNQLQLVEKSKGNWLRRKAEMTYPMVRHPGLHVELKFRSSSKSSCIHPYTSELTHD